VAIIGFSIKHQRKNSENGFVCSTRFLKFFKKEKKLKFDVKNSNNADLTLFHKTKKKDFVVVRAYRNILIV